MDLSDAIFSKSTKATTTGPYNIRHVTSVERKPRRTVGDHLGPYHNTRSQLAEWTSATPEIPQPAEKKSGEMRASFSIKIGGGRFPGR